MTLYDLYLIVDDQICSVNDLSRTLKSLLDSGITCVQLRMKQADKHVFTDTATEILKILRTVNIPLIINDAVDIAKIIDADGVHLGQNDMSVSAAREILGPEKIIGLSIENKDQALSCKYAAVNYFGVGPIFKTTSKADAAPPIGILELKSIVSILHKPVVAIGGITTDNVTEVLNTGVVGVAAISAILKAPDPKLQTINFANLIAKSRGRNEHE